jgi:MarR family transcriptional regulator, organic hydroperoxide resistance regulator
MKKPAQEPSSTADDVPRRAGGAALGARLRRLSDRIDREAGAVYASRGVAFEQRWFGIVHELHMHGPSSVAALAKCLGITHVAISQTRKALQEAGMIASASDPGDARRSLLSLSTKGRRLATRLESTWMALSAAAAELDAEAGNVVEALARLEEALKRRSLGERVLDHLGKQADAGD